MKKLIAISSVLAVLVGITMVVGGVWGIYFTYQNIAKEKIVTPADANIPEKPVRGPFTLKAQVDIIREHMLKMAGGKTYAEMPRQVAKLDENGKPVLDSQSKPVMMENTVRDTWITATTLTTALNLGIIAYAFSGLVLLFGAISIWTGMVLHILGRKSNLT